MLTYNTMRFGTDEFTFVNKRAMLIAKNPINASTDFNYVDKYIIEGENLTDDNIRFFFRVDKRESLDSEALSQNKVRYLRFTETGKNVTDHLLCYYHELADYSFDYMFEITANLSALQYMNDLYAAGKTNMASDDWQGGYIYPIILLQATDENAIPKVKFGMQLSKRTPVFEKVSHWSYTFDKPTKILDIAHEPILTGDASIDFKYAYIPQGGSSFTAYEKEKDDVVGQIVSGLAFKYTRTVTKIDGDDSACAGRYIVTSTEDTDAIVFGDSADLYSITKNYFLPLKYCAVIVKHADLNGAQLKAFAKFDPGKYFVTSENLGTADGSKQTFTLAHSKFFDPSTLKVYLDGVQTQNFEFNVEDNTVTLTATAGTVITAGYTYNLKAETWIELTADPTQHDIDNKLRVTRYHCSDVKQYGDNVMVSAIRLQFIRGENGNVPHVYGFTAGWAV